MMEEKDFFTKEQLLSMMTAADRKVGLPKNDAHIALAPMTELRRFGDDPTLIDVTDHGPAAQLLHADKQTIGWGWLPAALRRRIKKEAIGFGTPAVAAVDGRVVTLQHGTKVDSPAIINAREADAVIGLGHVFGAFRVVTRNEQIGAIGRFAFDKQLVFQPGSVI